MSSEAAPPAAEHWGPALVTHAEDNGGSPVHEEGNHSIKRHCPVEVHLSDGEPLTWWAVTSIENADSQRSQRTWLSRNRSDGWDG